MMTDRSIMLSYFRWGLFMILAAMFMDWVLKRSLHVGLLDVARWYVSNFDRVSPKPILAALAFFALLGWLMAQAFLTKAYWSITGVPDSYLYLGHRSQTSLMAVPPARDRPPVRLFESNTLTFGFNTSFKPLFSGTPVFRDRLTGEVVLGDPPSRGDLLYQAAMTALLGAFGFLCLCFLISIYQAGVGTEGPLTFSSQGGLDLARAVGERFGVSPLKILAVAAGGWTVAILALTVLMFSWRSSTPRGPHQNIQRMLQNDDEQMEATPEVKSRLQPGMEVQGVFLNQTQIKGRNKTQLISLLGHMAIFRFDSLFPVPVYVSLYFRTGDPYQSRIDALNRNETVPLRLTPALELEWPAASLRSNPERDR